MGFVSGESVRDLLPNTYRKFQGKIDELVKEQEDFERWISSIRQESVGEVPF